MAVIMDYRRWRGARDVVIQADLGRIWLTPRGGMASKFEKLHLLFIL